MTAEAPRKIHAHLEVRHRHRKAEKIVRLLTAERPLNGLNILEIGTGSEVISGYLAEVAGTDGHVSSVDVIDERVVRDGYDFTLVDGVVLPFENESFDVVVSNHVIEHVGGETEQLIHRSEIARVLRPDGIGYLAVPNRWALVEPHFQLWFLSWLPRFLRDYYVQASKRGAKYDCDPPGPMGIRSMIRDSGLSYQDRSQSAVRLIGEIEGKKAAYQLGRMLPSAILKALSPLYPTMIFLMVRA